jgi:ubiquinone/menaquinone biosynthesis C-methylase UbiE
MGKRIIVKNDIKSMNDQDLKNLIRDYWETDPCEMRYGKDVKDNRRYFFKVLDRCRYEKCPYVLKYADFESARGKKVLEIGPGAGSDFMQWARGGAILYGIDLTEASVNLCLERLKLEGLEADVRIGDAENLEFPNDFFDIVYSWGVIHHTPDTEKAVSEIHRVLKPGGIIKVMIYHSGGLTWKYEWILFGLLRLRPWKSLKQIAFEHNESPGTKIYSKKEAQYLFRMFSDVEIETVVDPGDALDFQLSDRYQGSLFIRSIKCFLFFLKHLRPYIPSSLGTTMFVRARKPDITVTWDCE